MNDHAGWTKDGRCVLCCSDDSSKPCEGLIEDDEFNSLANHKCLGTVPGTFVICGEGNFQYCSEACLNIAKNK